MSKKTSKRKKHSSGSILTVFLFALFIIIIAFMGLIGDKFAAFKLQEDEGSAPQLIITEVMSSNSRTLLYKGEYCDWFEVTNITDKPINLFGISASKGVTLSNDAFTFTAQLLDAGESTLVYCTGRAGDSEAAFKLPAAGCTLSLFDGGGDVIDTVIVPELISDTSYAYIDGEWRISQKPTPGLENTLEAFDRLTSTEDDALQVVVISEIMPRSATYEGGCDYIELYNPSPLAVELEGWCLSDDPSDPGKYVFPAMTLEPDGYTVITELRLDADGGSVTLTNARNKTVSEVSYPALETDRSYCLTNDGSYSCGITPTPGYSNDTEGAARTEAEFRLSITSGILITEIMASASSASGSYDWLEIRNTSSEIADISGWWLSDSPSSPRKWQFPDGSEISAGGYLGVYLSGEESINGGLHASFKLNALGCEIVTLAMPDGTVVDRVPLKMQYTDMSYGRIDGKDGFFYLKSATPGTYNVTEGWPDRLEKVSFSIDGGIYKPGSTFSLSLSAEADADIYYTLDSSEPDPTALDGLKYDCDREGASDTVITYLYTEPIEISGTAVVRAVAVKDGLLSSLINTQSYIYRDTVSPLKVVSLVTAPQNLWDCNNGIYVMGPNAADAFPYGTDNSGANFWMHWEKDANIELYDPDGSVLISQGTGIKLHGAYSRAYESKAFKVLARGRFGENRFIGKLFPNRDYTEYKSFILRPSGQDQNKTRMRDSLLTSLAAGTSVMYQDTNEVALYLNGEYWGYYNMREDINTETICKWEGWDESIKDSIDLLHCYYTVIQGSGDSYTDLVKWIEQNGIDTDEKLAYVAERVDLQNFMEFMAVQMYTSNYDFKNVRIYKSSLTDNKWRFILFDLDYGADIDENTYGHFLTKGAMGKGEECCNELSAALMKSPTFRDQYLTYFGEQLATTFSSENMHALTEAKLAKIGIEMQSTLERWNITQESYDSSLEVYFKFIDTRPGRMLYYFAGKDRNYSKLGLTRAEMEKYLGKVLENIDMLDAKYQKVAY